MLVSGVQQNDSIILIHTLGCPKSLFRFSLTILRKNLNELFGQPNIYSFSGKKKKRYREQSHRIIQWDSRSASHSHSGHQAPSTLWLVRCPMSSPHCQFMEKEPGLCADGVHRPGLQTAPITSRSSLTRTYLCGQSLNCKGS